MGATATLILAVAALGTAVGTLVRYLTASRKLSGKIGTSDATELWAASKEMRNEYRDDLASANKRLAALEGRLATVEADNHELANENLLLKRQVDLLKHENEILHRKVDELERALNKAKGV